MDNGREARQPRLHSNPSGYTEVRRLSSTEVPTAPVRADRSDNNPSRGINCCCRRRRRPAPVGNVEDGRRAAGTADFRVHMNMMESRRNIRSVISDRTSGFKRGAGSAEYTVTTIDEAPADDCPICLQALSGKCATTPCGHRFHEACLLKCLSVAEKRRARCPVCRGSLHPRMPVEAIATSGRPIEILDNLRPGDRCHFDRNYRFASLGDFADRPSMLYVMTSNEDKRTLSDTVMWTVETTVPVIIHLNFRSERHVKCTGRWLQDDGWKRSSMKSTVSSGIPHGPYSGPVFSKFREPGETKLMGAECQEGSYFVFVELQREQEQAPESPPDVSEDGQVLPEEQRNEQPGAVDPAAIFERMETGVPAAELRPLDQNTQAISERAQPAMTPL